MTLARIAVATLCLGAAVLVLLIVSGAGWDGLDGKVFAAVTLFAIFSLCSLAILTLAVAQASMLLSFRQDEDNSTINGVLFGSLGVLALLTVLVIAEISSPGPDISRKVLAALSVIYLLGALLPPLLRRTESL